MEEKGSVRFRLLAGLLSLSLIFGSAGMTALAEEPAADEEEPETEEAETEEEEEEPAADEEEPETEVSETDAGAPKMLASSSSNETQIYSLLTDTYGFSTAAACGILANMDAESGFNPTASSGSYYGLCQWGSDRLSSLKSYTSKWNTVAGQVDFLVYELKKSYVSVYNTLVSVANSADGAYTAGHDFCYGYEVPKNKDSVSNTRGDLAKNTYWPKYKSGAVTSTAAAVSTSASSSTKKTYTKYQVTGNNVNYRTGAGTSYSSAGKLSKGKQIDVEDGYSKKANGYTWYRFKMNSQNYYIASTYVKKVSSSSSSSSKTTYQTYKTTAKVNYRTGAGTSKKKAGTLSKGKKIQVEKGYSKKANGYTWYRFKQNGKNYYVASKYLKKVSSSSSSKTTYQTYKTTTKVNYRTGAGTSKKVAGTLKKGTKIQVEKGYSKKANGYTWYRFKKNGKQYYIASKYIKKA